MKKIITRLSAITVLFAFASCSKDAVQPAVADNMIGTWKFISIKAQTANTKEVTDGTETYKTLTTTSYVTEKNSGTFKFDGSKMSTENIVYSINAVGTTSVFENGTLTDSTSLPFQITAPMSSGSASYRKVGVDSIYVESGSAFMSGITQNSKGGGAKIKLENDKLYLIQSAAETETETEDGVTSISKVEGIFTITLQKQ